MRALPKYLKYLRRACLAALLPLSFGPLQAAPITELVAERAAAEYAVAMPENGYFSVRLADGLPRDGEYIQEFWVDQDTGQFIANVVSDRGTIQRVFGLAVLTVPIPMVNRRIQPEEIIQPQDIEMVDVPWARVHNFAVIERENLEGMQVRRMLAAGRPVHRQSVIPPIVVARGDRVTIQLQFGGMHLTAKGKAISDAHKGQELRVVNLASNKTIIAVARANGLVEAQF
ncbi:flagellar basal body P-ring formation chaperone FlgA [Cognatishimia sp. SS12]|uniref:flagellar basal body P-ring formation chaperone FlgA n=1 Tax=Cognatishimia sp. SS12 TaxID=2979465 RepID=UPI00232B0D47|nr:flagellar basal body P-ring formation chaperone FlgA [Cognatishimia sp. SS12]MDC0739459.1 flagellar basal body P-ring formation chaperone FlgA [Cognatishimia sp. SS12]